MKLNILLALIIASITHTAHADSDREEIKAVMEYFYAWDLYGGKENSSKSMSDTVLYHRIDQDGKHSYNTPSLDSPSGKGADVVKHNLVDIDIYNNMAVVTSLHRYMPESPENTYIKKLILFKLADGWRITNVSWGRVTSEK